ncbi:MAG: hypothetical protein GY772_17680, partial [bacterium]|nr:hypothetical protein [bacterium]
MTSLGIEHADSDVEAAEDEEEDRPDIETVTVPAETAPAEGEEKEADEEEDDEMHA